MWKTDFPLRHKVFLNWHFCFWGGKRMQNVFMDCGKNFFDKVNSEKNGKFDQNCVFNNFFHICFPHRVFQKVRILRDFRLCSAKISTAGDFLISTRIFSLRHKVFLNLSSTGFFEISRSFPHTFQHMWKTLWKS